MTIAYYDRFAQAFWEGTRHHDVSQNYAAFLDAIKGDPPYSILDLGCGPGRDLSHFRSLGHEAVGLDGSQQLVAMARAHSQCEVLHQDFLAMQLMAGGTIVAPLIMGFDPNRALLFSGVGTLIFFVIVAGRPTQPRDVAGQQIAHQAWREQRDRNLRFGSELEDFPVPKSQAQRQLIPGNAVAEPSQKPAAEGYRRPRLRITLARNYITFGSRTLGGA